MKRDIGAKIKLARTALSQFVKIFQLRFRLIHHKEDNDSTDNYWENQERYPCPHRVKINHQLSVQLSVDFLQQPVLFCDR